MEDSLQAIREDIVQRLSAAVGDRRSPMHTPVVASGDAGARVMVLRDFDPGSWTLRFHTDARAPKVRVIESDPRVTVLAYDRDSNLQIRLTGHGRILRDGEIVEAAWAQATNFARRCYLGAGPGEETDGPDSGLPSELEGVEPDDAQLVPARSNFAVLLVEIREADWFCLAHSGHRRAIVNRHEGRWVTP